MKDKRKRTPAFPGSVRPARIGVYERLSWNKWWYYSYWDGVRWHCGDLLCRSRLLNAAASTNQHWPWRGLAEEPK